MTTRDDLVSRLREQPPVMSIKHSSDCAVNDHTFPEDTADWSDCNCFATRKHDIDLFNEAATAIEAKDAEILRLRADRNQMMKQVAELGRQLAEETEQCAWVAENAFGGRANTYASENADLYRGQDMACQRIAAAIRGGAK